MRSIYDINKKFFWDTLTKRRLSPDQIYISNHFINRYNQRRLDAAKVYKLINKFSDSICKIIYEFEIGNKPKVEYDNIVLQLSYVNGKVFFMTCYDKTTKD